MALPALATVGELAAWMQREPAELPEGAALVLDTASAIVRSEARQRFTRGTSTVALALRDQVVTLPQRPVVSVELVRAGGRELRPDEFRLWRDELWFVGSYGSAVVTYSHGYAEVPANVRAIVLTLAGRVLTNPSDLRQESVGSVSVTYAAETIGASLAPIERDQLARYRPGAAVVQLGKGRPW
ncbi:hypothetical protein [Streptomyces sp. OspMP-M43]|uniref:hypothetical protein n=1 Tax=Streptomyces sp. OspMP-M43 TaxID=1839781 RepID=UPI00081B7B0B|nr:hypothetical protein [Streptomyces sp. OspMP-M43]SCD35545.1 hypothetical protein GA0115261_1000817 [Streptomyces sp. OspMP-M43]